MIGNEQINPEFKFMELFSRVTKLELALAEALDRIAEITAVLGAPPKSYDKPISNLRSGTR